MVSITALIVDDEPLARVYLRLLLEDFGVTVLGEAGNAQDAINRNTELKPKVLFLDIELPGVTGLQLAQTMVSNRENTLIVFVTGYSQHALAAFDYAAFDYLVKPVEQSRLLQTLVRIKDHFARPTQEITVGSLMTKPVHRLPIRQDYSVLLPRFDEVRSAISGDKRVVIHLETEEYKTYYTLRHLEDILPPESFLRVHESAIVNLEYVEEILYLGSHNYAVRLIGGQHVPVSRKRFALLQEKLGVTSHDPENL